MENRSNNFFIKLMQLRKSVRSYSNKELPATLLSALTKILENSPTGCNKQELEMLYTNSKYKLRLIQEYKPHAKNATGLVMLYYNSTDKFYKEKIKNNLPYLDAGCAIMAMHLYCTEQGLGSCIINLSDDHSRNKGLLHVNKFKYLKYELGYNMKYKPLIGLLIGCEKQ